MLVIIAAAIALRISPAPGAPTPHPTAGYLQLASVTLTGTGKAAGSVPPPGGKLDFSIAANSGLLTLF